MAILSGIIINKNLKLLLINYLARKVDVYFIFLLGHNILGTELVAGLCIQKFEKEYSTKSSHAGNFIGTSVWTGHIGSR